MKEKLRIIVTGLIGSIPTAGLTLHYLQYVLGLKKLGHNVLYLEDVGGWYVDTTADRYYDPRVNPDEESILPISYLSDVMHSFDLDGSWSYIDHNSVSHGLSKANLDKYIKSADILINITDFGTARDEYTKIPKRAFIDTDPGFLQFRIANGSDYESEVLNSYSSVFSFAHNIGDSDCKIPTLGLNWLPTQQPIYIEFWENNSTNVSNNAFTTILKWSVYKSVEYKGEEYGLKDIEFLKYIELPKYSIRELEIATIGIPPVDNITNFGWKIKSAPEICSTIQSYKKYIQSSIGEWSVAKNCYVKSNSGWFSERSAAYLASGRPVLLQETGYSKWLPTGNGVLAFENLNEAVEGIENVSNNYEIHCKEARSISIEYFNSEKVLRELIQSIYH